VVRAKAKTNKKEHEKRQLAAGLCCSLSASSRKKGKKG
jgi:hypothetical protein